MPVIKSNLAQSRPATTSNTTIISGETNTLITIQDIIICNTTGSAVTYKLFMDNDGTTYDQSTALAYDFTVAANGKEHLSYGKDAESGLYISKGGTLAVQVSTGSALTFTVNGMKSTSGA